jgi:hypothetical protein
LFTSCRRIGKVERSDGDSHDELASHINRKSHVETFVNLSAVSLFTSCRRIGKVERSDGDNKYCVVQYHIPDVNIDTFVLPNETSHSDECEEQ